MCVLLGLGAALALMSLTGGETARAQTGPGAEQIVGTVTNQYEGEDGKRVREPVEGVRIVVTATDGTAAGEALSGADGKFVIVLPGPGGYTITLDASSVPDGMDITDDTKPVRQVNVTPAGTQNASFFLGKDLRNQQSRLELLPQTLFNGLKLSSIIAICAIGLALIYGTTGLSNFAHGELVTFGALMAYVANQIWHLHIFLAIIVGAAAGAAAGGALERAVWRPMRHRRSSLTSMMIVSIGLALGARYLFQFRFGARSRPYRQFAVQKEWDLGPFSATPRSLGIIATCVIMIVAVCLFLLRTRFGKAIRAVADNPDLASTTGINSDRVILAVWLLGGGLAGLGGVLFGLDVRVSWDMGNTILLLMFAAITIGGLGNPFGALLGSFFIGMFVELWTWVFPSVVELKTVGALLALIVLLLVRPQGMLGKKERIG